MVLVSQNGSSTICLSHTSRVKMMLVIIHASFLRLFFMAIQHGYHQLTTAAVWVIRLRKPSTSKQHCAQSRVMISHCSGCRHAIFWWEEHSESEHGKLWKGAIQGLLLCCFGPFGFLGAFQANLSAEPAFCYALYRLSHQQSIDQTKNISMGSSSFHLALIRLNKGAMGGHIQTRI